MSRWLRDTLLTALAILWLIAIVFGFWWFQARLVVTFDNDQRILTQYPLLSDYSQALSGALPTLENADKVQVTIIREPGCHCNRYSSEHLASVQMDFKSTADFHSRWLNDLPRPLQSLIPATPFVVVQRPGGQLTYAGPVNTGVSCTSDSTFLGATLSRTEITGTQIPLLARGCYCTVAALTTT